MIEIRLEENRNRAAAYDGEKEAGECTYQVRNGKWIIDHTFTDPAYGGQGIAGKMVQCIAEAAQEKNVIIVPVCSYAAHWFSKHPEYRTEQI